MFVGVFAARAAWAENMSIGVGSAGLFHFIEGNPQLDPGLGGHVYFDYRFAQQVSTQVTVRVTTQQGRGTNAGDRDVLYFALPTVAFKYYFLESSQRVDPYAQLGVGLHMTSEGSRADGTMAFGFGGNAGVGLDFYVTPSFSLNAAATFDSIGMVGSTGANNGAGLFPLTAVGGLAYHF